MCNFIKERCIVHYSMLAILNTVQIGQGGRLYTIIKLRTIFWQFNRRRSYHAVANNLLEPNIRVRVIPMFEDNYGAVQYWIFRT